MENEIELIKKAKAGDKLAFEKIVIHYRKYVFAIVYKFIKDQNEIENIVQEIFIQIYISLGKYKFDNFKAWIGRLATNKTIDYLRSKKTHFKEETMEGSTEIIDIFTREKVKTPEELFLIKEKEDEILELLEKIPKIYRDVIIGFYMEGKSYEEMALEESVEIKTIASRLYRGKLLLKNRLEEENETL